MNMSVPLPIGRAAKLLGIPTWRIRDWEAKGLISPLRKASGHRMFGEAEMRRLAELRELLLSEPEHLSGGAPHSPLGVSAADLQPDTEPLPELQQNANRMSKLGAAAIRLAKASGSYEGLKPALEFALDTVLDLTDARVGTISYADNTRQRYVLTAHRGLSIGYVKGIETWQLDEGLAGRAYSLREPVLIDDLAADPAVPRTIVHEEGLRGYICVPILRGGQRLGIIEVFSKSRNAFTIDDVRTVEVVGGAISATVESSRLKDELDFFRSQRDNISRHWTTQLSRAVEDFHADATNAVIALADDLRERPLVDPAGLEQELRNLASGLTSAHLLTVNLRDTVERQLVEGEAYMLGRTLDLAVSECDVNIDYGLAGRILGLLESLISQVAHSAQRSVSVRLELRDELEIEVHDDVERPNRTDFVQSFNAACTRLLKSLDAEARSPVIGYGHSAVWVRVPLQIEGRALQQLTPKELEVLKLLGRGYTNRELAHELFISPKTLQNHLTAIYRKLGVKNRTEAIMLSTSQV